jgi:type II secretory pathway component GspD/PulD (secretin)
VNSFAHALMVGTLVAGTATPTLTQPPPAPPPAPRELKMTQLTLQVVVSKSQGDKKVSSVPYSLSVVANSNRNGSLRLGSRLPIVTQVGTQVGGAGVSNVQYADVGIGIDCMAISAEEGRYRLDLTVEDTSVVAEPPAGVSRDQPVFRNFKASESILLRDGQSAQFTAATDKLTGEVTRVEVTLTVGK